MLTTKPVLKFFISIHAKERERKGNEKKLVLATTAVLMAGSLFAVGCAQQGQSEEVDVSTETQYKDSIEKTEAYYEEVQARQDEINQ